MMCLYVHRAWLVYRRHDSYIGHMSLIYPSTVGGTLWTETWLIGCFVRVMSPIHESWLTSISHVSYLWVMSPIYESCLLSMSHASYIWACLLYVFFMSPIYIFISRDDSYIGDITHIKTLPVLYESRLLYMGLWHVSYIWVCVRERLKCAHNTPSTVCNTPCTETWLVYRRHDSYRETWLVHRRHDSYLETRLIHRRHDSYIEDMTRIWRHDSYIEDMTRI